MAFIKKRIGTLIIIAIFLCAGNFYANVNAAALSNWYIQSVQKEDDKLGSAVKSRAWTSIKHLESFLFAEKANADSAIEETRNKQVKEAKSAIDELLNDMTNQFNKTVTELEKENFDHYVENRNIDKEIEQDVETILADVLGE